MSVAPPFAVDLRREVPGGQPARRVIEAIFPNADVAYVEEWSSIADVVRSTRGSAAGDLRRIRHSLPAGPARVSAESDGVDTTREDYLAYLAGTVIEQDELDDVQRRRRRPRRLAGCPMPRRSHVPADVVRLAAPLSDDDAITGTSPTGTARAIAWLWW